MVVNRFLISLLRKIFAARFERAQGEPEFCASRANDQLHLDGEAFSGSQLGINTAPQVTRNTGLWVGSRHKWTKRNDQMLNCLPVDNPAQLLSDGVESLLRVTREIGVLALGQFRDEVAVIGCQE